jgi:hypothetical protein
LFLIPVFLLSREHSHLLPPHNNLPSLPPLARTPNRPPLPTQTLPVRRRRHRNGGRCSVPQQACPFPFTRLCRHARFAFRSLVKTEEEVGMGECDRVLRVHFLYWE